MPCGLWAVWCCIGGSSLVAALKHRHYSILHHPGALNHPYHPYHSTLGITSVLSRPFDAGHNAFEHHKKNIPSANRLMNSQTSR